MTFFAGFDAGSFPGQAVMDWLKKQSNLTWCGYYLGPVPNHGGASWMGQRPSFKDQWGLLPIYVGQQDPNTGRNPSSILTTAQGTVDAQQACDMASAEGFPAGTYIYLDWESGGVDAAGASDYIQAWLAAVAASGTAMPGIYCSHRIADRIASLVSAMNPVPTVRYWCWKVADADPHRFTGDLATLPTIDPTGCGASQAIAWQREQRAQVDVMDGGASTIEMDFSTSSLANPAAPDPGLAVASGPFIAPRSVTASVARAAPIAQAPIPPAPIPAPAPTPMASSHASANTPSPVVAPTHAARHAGSGGGRLGIWLAVALVVALLGGLATWRMSLDDGSSSIIAKATKWPSECLPLVTFAANDHVTLLDGAKARAEGNGAITLPLPVAASSLKDGDTATFTDLKSKLGDVLPLKKEAGDFSFELTSDAILRNDAGVEVDGPKGLKLAPVASVTYDTSPVNPVSGAIKVQGSTTQWTIRAGSPLGTLAGGAVQVAFAQPIKARARAAGMLPAPKWLQFSQVTGSNGLRRIAGKAEVLAPSAGHSPQSILVCASLDGQSWRQSLVTAMTGVDSDLLAIDLPGGQSASRNWAFQPVAIIVAANDGSSFSEGQVNLVDKRVAALIGLGLTVLLLGALMFGRGRRRREKNLEARWISGLFTGPDNDPSLSLLQIFIWTAITVWGFLYVFVLVGSLLTMTAEMMQLLGIAGAGSVAARLIASANGGSTSKGPSSPDAPSGGFWQMMSTNGQFDLLKLQLFVFTAVIAPYVVYRILDSGAFPALDANTLMLLGVSQGVYVTSKLSAVTPLAKAQAIKISLSTAQEVLDNANAVVSDLQTRLQSVQAQVGAGQPTPAVVTDLQAQLQAAKLAQQTAASQVASLTANYAAALSALGLKQS